MNSHAANPFARRVEGTVYAVLFNCRDQQNRSHVAEVVVDIERPRDVLELSSSPLLSPGSLGTFDEAGVSVGSVVVDEFGIEHLFYLGWSLGSSVPFINLIGRAERTKGAQEFTRTSAGPVLGRSTEDPYSLSYPWVMRFEDRWLMWYGSNTGPTPRDRKRIPHVIKLAESTDLVDWKPQGTVVELKDVALSRPALVVTNNELSMWYSARQDQYTIRHRVSSDGRRWEAGPMSLEPSGSGWDADSVCYPCVVVHDGRRLMFYNGNGYGQTGFGIAIEG